MHCSKKRINFVFFFSRAGYSREPNEAYIPYISTHRTKKKRRTCTAELYTEQKTRQNQTKTTLNATYEIGGLKHERETTTTMVRLTTQNKTQDCVKSETFDQSTDLLEIVQELCGFPVQCEGVLALHVLHSFVQLHYLRAIIGGLHEAHYCSSANIILYTTYYWVGYCCKIPLCPEI